MTAALESGVIDVVGQFSVAAHPQLLDGRFNIINFETQRAPGAVHAKRHGSVHE